MTILCFTTKFATCGSNLHFHNKWKNSLLTIKILLLYFDCIQKVLAQVLEEEKGSLVVLKTRGCLTINV